MSGPDYSTGAPAERNPSRELSSRVEQESRKGAWTSTVIPALGVTFRDAADRCLGLIAQQNSTSTDTEEGEARADALAWQWISILDVILAAPPVSMADGVAIADLLMDSTIGLPISGVHGAKLTAFASLRDLMARQAAQDAADAELLSLFRQWVENESLFDGNPLSDEDASVASDNGKRLMLEIAAIPAHTAIGFSIKIYAREHWLHGSPAGQPATAVRMPDLPPEAVEAVFQRNMFRDALRVMPELNALMGDAALPAEVADV